MDLDSLYKYAINCLKSGVANVRADEAGMPCPNSDCDDEGGHFSINIRNGLFNCFKCHFSGTLLRVISRHRSEWLSVVGNTPGEPKGKMSLVFPFCGTPLYAAQRGGVIRDKKRDGLAMQALRIEEYCLERGMTKKQIADYRVSIKPHDPRAYFPYWNEKGELTFWMGRAIKDSVEPKTIEPTDSEKPLFGRHVRCLEHLVLLVEGVFDHFVTPDSYALMGSSVTGSQIAQLRLDSIRKVVLVQDPDAGEAMALNSIKLRRFGIKAYVCMLRGFRDPAKLGRKTMGKITEELRRLTRTRLTTIIHLKV